MKSCCIKGCSSCSTSIGRSLYEVNDGRKSWIDIIKNHQPINENIQLYVCDLHFNPSDIRMGRTKSTLRRGAVPNINILLEVPNEIIENFEVNEPVADVNGPGSLTYVNVQNSLPAHSLTNFCNETISESITMEPKMKPRMITIPVKEYNDLILKVAKLEKINRSMKNLIENKDSYLKELKASHIEELKKVKNQHLQNLTSEQVEVIDCLVNGIQNGQSYPESVRLFTLRQQYYSTAAYESLKHFFNNNLPSMRTIRFWYTSIDGSPGISTTSLNIIREKAELHQAENNYQLHLTLISDEMSIRKQISWSNELGEFVGFCTTINSSKRKGKNSQNSLVLDEAKDALVFLIVGPNFKLPVAYHLLNGLESIDRARITREVINSIEDCGVKIISLTSDGLRANIVVAELLGAKFDQDKTYFLSTKYPEQKIYIIFDPPHMLKLVRKHFASGNLHSPNGQLDWNLIRILAEKQGSENFNLCNKLTMRHINWHERPMNVRLAAQTISNSVADVLEQLQKDNYEEFENAGATTEFLRNFNNIFDVMNCSESTHPATEYKQPISEETEDFIFQFLETMRTYIQNLEIEVRTKNCSCRKSILRSRAQMGFFGFNVDIISLKGIYNDFVKMGPLEIFYPMQFSQDHIETFFSLIRNCLGRNDNPNSIEFSGAFRKLLVCHPLTTSHDHNTITNSTGILTTSSRTKKILKPITPAETLDMEVYYEETMQLEIETMEEYDKHTCAYVASCIEETMMKYISRKNSCVECANTFGQNEKIDDELLKRKNQQSKQPCKSTFDIVVFSNAVVKMIEPDENYRIDTVKKTICENLNIDNLFTRSIFEHGEQNHRKDFVTQIVQTYLSLKSQKIGKKISDEKRGVHIRSRLKAHIHEMGQ